MPLVKVQHVNKVILGYGNLRDEEIEEGVCRISAILERNNNIFIRSLAWKLFGSLDSEIDKDLVSYCSRQMILMMHMISSLGGSRMCHYDF
jgi:hypothetical protein